MNLRLLLLASFVGVPACGSCADSSPSNEPPESTTTRPVTVRWDGGRKLFRRHDADAAGTPHEAADAAPAR